MHKYLLLCSILWGLSCSLSSAEYDEIADDILPEENKMLACTTYSNNCLAGFFCDLSKYKCRPCAVCQEGQYPIESMCTHPTACPSSDDERHVLRCPDLPKHVHVLECYYGNVLGSWCSVSCEGDMQVLYTVGCTVNASSLGDNGNRGNSSIAPPVPVWNTSLTDVCSKAPSDGTPKSGTTPVVLSSSSESTHALISPQADAVHSQELAASASTNFVAFAVAGVLLAVATLILIIIIILLRRSRSSQSSIPTASSIEQANNSNPSLDSEMVPVKEKAHENHCRPGNTPFDKNGRASYSVDARAGESVTLLTPNIDPRCDDGGVSDSTKRIAPSQCTNTAGGGSGSGHVTQHPGPVEGGMLRKGNDRVRSAGDGRSAFFDDPNQAHGRGAGVDGSRDSTFVEKPKDARRAVEHTIEPSMCETTEVKRPNSDVQLRLGRNANETRLKVP